MHNFGTCVWRTAAQWHILIFPASKHVFFPEVATALWFSKRKSRSCVQTWISVSSTFWYWEHMAISLWKIISYHSAFAFRSSARALAAALPRQGHVYRTTAELFRFHHKNCDEIRCKLDSTDNARSFEKYPTPPIITKLWFLSGIIVALPLQYEYGNTLVNCIDPLANKSI